MQPIELNPQKLYYSIGEVATMFGVNASLIRFWEKEFDVIKPNKNKKGNRLFTAKDIQNISLIYHLVKERKYTLEGAKKKLKDNKNDLSRDMEIIQSLEKMKAFLLDLKASL